MDEASSNSWCSGAAVRVSRSSQFRGVGLPEGDGHRAGGDVAVTGGESIRVVAPSHTGRLDMAKGEGEDATNARPLVPLNEQPSVSCARAQQVRARVACTAWGAPQTSYRHAVFSQRHARIGPRTLKRFTDTRTCFQVAFQSGLTGVLGGVLLLLLFKTRGTSAAGRLPHNFGRSSRPQ